MESVLSIKLKAIGHRAWKIGQGIEVQPKYILVQEENRFFIKRNEKAEEK